MKEQWEHDLQLSIHCYYSKEIDAGFRASERILNSSAPQEIKDAAMRNLTFYTKSLSDICPTVYRKINCKPANPNWSLFNPTITNYGDNLIILVRSSNYTMEDGNYITPPEDDSVIRNEYIQLITDKNFNVLSEHKIKLTPYCKTKYLVDGLEDLRIFKIKNNYYVSGTIRNLYPFDWMCRIGVASYDPITCQVGPIKVIDLKNNKHEKNWMPILDENSDELKWIYHSNINGETIIINDKNDNFMFEKIKCDFIGASNYRGGSQLIKVNNNYYSIIHEVTICDSKRVYLHRMIEWDDNFNIKRVGKILFLKKERAIEFSSGMCFSNGQIHIVFGLEDKEAYLASFEAKHIDLLF